MPPEESVVLRRGPAARLLAGYWFQGLLSVVLLFSIGVGVVIGVLDAAPTDAFAYLGFVPILALWGGGVLAGARADGGGVRWRYYAVHEHPWSQIESIRFGSTFVPGGTVGASAPAVFVTSDGREKPVRPTYGCSTRRRTEFAAGLAALAATHGVPTSVTNAGWEGLEAARQPVARAPFATPGVTRSAQNTRVRVGVFGLAMVVAGVLSIVGAFTGWDSSGTSPVALGVIGGVLLLVGGLVVALMLVTGP